MCRTGPRGSGGEAVGRRKGRGGGWGCQSRCEIAVDTGWQKKWVTLGWQRMLVK